MTTARLVHTIDNATPDLAVPTDRAIAALFAGLALFFMLSRLPCEAWR